MSIRVFTTPCTSPCCHSAVSMIVITAPLHVQVLTATVLCQNVSLVLLCMYKSSLPQFCVNKGSYYPMYKSFLPQCCVNNVVYYPSTCTSPYCHSSVSIRALTTPCTSLCCHSAVSIRFITTPLHVQVLAVTVMCQ